MQVGATAGTPALQSDIFGDDGAALRAAHDVSEARHADVLRAVLPRNTTRARARARLRRGPRSLGLRLAVAVGVLVAALSVLAVVTHGLMAIGAVRILRPQASPRALEPSRRRLRWSSRLNFDVVFRAIVE